MSNDSINRKIGAILQFFQLFVSIIISTVYTSYMIKKLGQSEYSIFSVCSSTIGYLSLMSLGMNSSYIRFFTRAKTKEDDISVEELNWQYICMFSIFGFISLILGIIISFRVDLFFSSEYSIEELNRAKVLMLIFAVNMAFSFPASVFTSYISSQQRFIFLKLVNVFKTVFSPLAQFLLLILGYGSIGMAIALMSVNSIADIIYIFFCLNKLNMKIVRCKLHTKFLKRIAGFSVFIGINQIVNQLNFSADKLILSKFTNAQQVAVYSVAATLNSNFEQVGSSIANLFDPQINKIISSDENYENKKVKIDNIFIKVGRVQLYILLLIVTGFVFYGKYFIQWWAGDGYESSYYVALLLIIPLSVPLIQNTAVYVQRAKYKHKFRSLLYLCTSIINIFVSFFLVHIWGAIGAALGTTITLTINSIVINIYYKKVIDLDIRAFWHNILLSSKGIVIPIIWGYASGYLLPCIDNLSFILNIFIYSIIYIISVIIFSFNEYEKELLIRVKEKFVSLLKKRF